MRRPGTLSEQTLDGRQPERGVVGAGRTAGPEEGVHLVAEAPALGVSEVEVVHRQHRGPGAEAFAQHCLKQGADRRLSGALATSQPDHDRAAGHSPGVFEPGGQRQVHRPEPRLEIGIDRHLLACAQEGGPAGTLPACEPLFGEESLCARPLDGCVHARH